jgi:hypothetical protein
LSTFIQLYPLLSTFIHFFYFFFKKILKIAVILLKLNLNLAFFHLTHIFSFIHFYPVLSTFSQIYHFFFDFLEYGKKIAVFSIISTLNRQCKKFELQHYQYYTTIFFRVNSCIQHQKFGELTASVTTVTTQKTGSCDRC